MGSVFGVCKTNNNKIWANNNGSAHEIHISWLYYGDIKIRDTFVYKRILVEQFPQPQPLPQSFGSEYQIQQ